MFRHSVTVSIQANFPTSANEDRSAVAAMEEVAEPTAADKQHPVAALAKGMEHMRPYVSVTPTPHHPPAPMQAVSASSTTTANTNSTSKASSDVYGIPSAAINPAPHPNIHIPSSSREIPNPHKRTDPFQFGTRLLTEESDIFAHNAWDHVSVDSTFASFAETQYTFQRENPVPAFDAARYNGAPAKAWEKFYRNNTSNFFKDRKWLFQEFPSLKEATRKGAGAVRVLEVGAGAGNTAFPLLRENENEALKVHAVDYAAKAVDVMRTAEAYDTKYMQADVWDAAGVGEGEVDAEGHPPVSLPPGLERESMDIVVLIFIFSALAPAQWAQALRNIDAVLKPGGEILFRDYGRGDLAQVRFKKGRWLEENFYIRGDGTRVYFFEEEELRQIWGGDSIPGTPRFDILNLATDRRMLVNRQRKLKMYRCWMQGRFRKPSGSAAASVDETESQTQVQDGTEG